PVPCQVLAAPESIDHFVTLGKAHGDGIAVVVLGLELIDLLIKDPVFGERMRAGEASFVRIEAAIARMHLPQGALVENGVPEFIDLIGGWEIRIKLCLTPTNQVELVFEHLAGG